jgi:hypothetical protein
MKRSLDIDSCDYCEELSHNCTCDRCNFCHGRIKGKVQRTEITDEIFCQWCLGMSVNECFDCGDFFENVNLTPVIINDEDEGLIHTELCKTCNNNFLECESKDCDYRMFESESYKVDNNTRNPKTYCTTCHDNWVKNCEVCCEDVTDYLVVGDEDDDEYLCKVCHEKDCHVLNCKNCHELFWHDEMVQVGNPDYDADYYCENCAEEDAFFCEFCECIQEKWGRKEVSYKNERDDAYMCDECYKRLSREHCTICGETSEISKGKYSTKILWSILDFAHFLDEETFVCEECLPKVCQCKENLKADKLNYCTDCQKKAGQLEL